MSHELVLKTNESSFTVAISNSDDKLKDIKKFIDIVIKAFNRVDNPMSSEFDDADFDSAGCICGIQDQSFELIPLTNENSMDISCWVFAINSKMFADKTEELFGVRLEFASQTGCDRVGVEYPAKWTQSFIRPSKVVII